MSNVATAKGIKLRRADYAALAQRVNMEASKTTVLPTTEEGTWIRTVERVEVFHAVTPGFPDIIFDVRAIKDAIVRQEISHFGYECPITKEWYEKILADGGVEEGRIATLTGEDLKRIIVAVHWPQGWTQIIDGNNRFVKRYRVGLRTVRFVVVELLTCITHGLACEPGHEADMLMLRRNHFGANVTKVEYTRIDPHSPEVKKLLDE